MMRRDAKAMVAYSGLAELKAALDPRQRFVDEITPVGQSMAEVSRGEALLSSAGRAAPLTGGFTAGSRALAKSCGRVAAIGKIARAFKVMDRVFTGKLAADNGTSRASGRSSDLFQLGCISKMRGTNRSARVSTRFACLTSSIAKWWPQNAEPGKNPKRVLPGSSTKVQQWVSRPRAAARRC